MEFTSKKIELTEYTADSGKCFKKVDTDGNPCYATRLLGANINIEDYEVVDIAEKEAYVAAQKEQEDEAH